MSKKYTLLLLLFSCCTFCACNKYLDVVPLGKAVLTDFSDYDKLLDNTTTYSLHYYPEGEVTYLSDQAGVEDNSILPNTAPSPMSIAYTFDEGNSRLSAGISSSVYSNAYKGIARMNIIIEGANASNGGTDAQKKQLIAEARALRAFAHFILVNTYAKPYNPATAATDNAIPLKTRYNLEESVAPSTVAEVYNFIVSELQAATNDLAVTPKNTFHPSRAFAYALLAKVYLFERQYDKAKQAAQQALTINKYIFDLVAYKATGQANTISQSMQENIYYAMGGLSNYPGPNVLISRDMYNSYEATDARKSVFFANGLSASGCTAAFTKNLTGNSAYAYNATGIRTTDVYLMLAECFAREGNITNAAALVDSVRVKRVAAFTPSTVTDAKSAMTLIMNERRKELLFGFNRFLDQRRLGVDPEYAITATRVFPLMDATRPHVTYTLKPTSFLYTIPMDQGTMQGNPNLKENTNDAKNW